MLWNRAGSNLEPSTWEKQAKPSTPTADVRLIPRDDRDLGFDDGPDDAGTGQPDARGAMQVDDDNAAGDKPERADQPPTRVRRVYTTPKNAEPHSRATALCALVEYVSGQITCATCGYEPLSVDEKWPSQTPSQQKNKGLGKAN